MFTKRRARPCAGLGNGDDTWERRRGVVVLCAAALTALSGSVTGCASHALGGAQAAAVGRTRQSDAAAREVMALKAEIARLQGAVAELSRRLDAQPRTLTEARDASSSEPARVAAEAPSTDATRAERSREEGSREDLDRDLRNAGRALLRVVSRLELPPDAKHELLQSLRPVRQLDLENPWVATK